MLRQTFNVLIMDHVRSWLCWRAEGSEGKGAGKSVSRLSSDIKSISHVSSRQMSRVPSSQFSEKKGGNDKVEWRNNRKNQIKKLFMSNLFARWVKVETFLVGVHGPHPSVDLSFNFAPCNHQPQKKGKQHSHLCRREVAWRDEKFNQNEKWTQNEWKIQIKINSRQTSEMTHALTLQVHFHILRAGGAIRDVMSTFCYSMLQWYKICVVHLIRSRKI